MSTDLIGPKPKKQSNLTGQRDILDTFFDYRISGVNCVAVGTITVFNPLTQTVEGTINYRRWDGQNWVEYPSIMSAPLVMLTGGSAQLTFPVRKGDTCIFLFNDRPISAWLISGQVGPLPNFRMHSIADGMALVGVRSLLNCIKVGDAGFPAGYDMLHAILAWGATQVGVSATQVRIANSAGTLGTHLGNLITQIQAIAATVESLTAPNPVLDANLLLIKTQLAALLE